jgi:hypothetical protein
MHLKERRYQGGSVDDHIPHIIPLVLQSGARTLLDYGCGKGGQYTVREVHNLWGGIMPTLYDPAVPGLDQRPERRFDGVICTDVLEHIPEDELVETLEDIRGYADKWVYLGIFCGPAKKRLPDGRNAHVTIRPPKWWGRLVRKVFDESGPDVHTKYRIWRL